MSMAYQPRTGDIRRDRERVLATWAGNLGRDEAMPAKYRWFYEGASGPPPLLQMLDHEGATVGTCAAGIRDMAIGDRRLRAGVLVDLAVLPGHRSLGPALMLQEALLAQAQGQLDLVYAFPNPRAAAVFKRMGYAHAADIRRHVRILRSGGYLARRMPAFVAIALGAAADVAARSWRRMKHPGLRRLEVSLQDGVDARLEALCLGHPLPRALTAHRTADHLRWRFDRKPGAKARHALVHDRAGELRAWFCWEAQGGTASVLDFWCTGSVDAMDPACIEALCRRMRRQGFAAIQVQMATSATRLEPWRSAGFRLRGARPLFIRWLREAPPHVDLHMTAADEDE